jgi:hypothetical protein
MGTGSCAQRERLLGVSHGSNARYAGDYAIATMLINVVSVLLTTCLDSK